MPTPRVPAWAFVNFSPSWGGFFFVSYPTHRYRPGGRYARDVCCVGDSSHPTRLWVAFIH